MTAGPGEGETQPGRATTQPDRDHRPTTPPPPTPPSPAHSAPSSPAIEPKPDTGALTPESLLARTLEAVGEKPSAHARLESIAVVRIEGSVVFIRPVSAAHVSRVRTGVSWYEERFTNAAGRTLRVRLETPEDDESNTRPSAPAPGLDDAALRREAEGNPLVRTAMDLFQARLVKIENMQAPTDAEPTTPDDDDDGDES